MKTKITNLCILCLGLVATISGCKKETSVSEDKTKARADSLLSVFQNTKVINNPFVRLSKDSSRDLLNSMQANSGIRDSIWANNQGHTYFVESSDIKVSDETSDYVYPGAIFNSKNIVKSYVFLPLSYRDYTQLPIRASLSIPGPSVSGVIEHPSLDETRDFIGKILSRPGNVEQINTFSYTSSQFTDYNELKYTFGANVDVAKIFKAALTGSGTKIGKKTGIIARFVQENFTVDMSLPRKNELISVSDANALMVDYAPVYVSSVTYGRMGVFIAETDASYEEFNLALKAAVNIGVVGVDTHVTAEQKALLDQAKITIFMKYGVAKPVAETINGYENFKNAIIAGATVNSSSYGGPISFRLRNLKDFSLFKTVFKIDVHN